MFQIQPQLPRHYRGDIFSIRAASLPYHIADVNLPRHWDHTKGGEGITWGIADTGVDENHPELQGKIYGAKNFVKSRRKRAVDPTDFADRNGHGTHVAGIIAGEHVGVAPKTKLCIAKVLGDYGSGSDVGIVEGITWLVDQGVQGINLSLGSPYDSPSIREVINYAKSKGVICLIATGNEGGKVGYPAAHGYGIGAVDKNMNLAEFSNRGPLVDAVGYGVNVYSCIPNSLYQEMSGTSMATPYVSGFCCNRLSAELFHCGNIITKTEEDIYALSTYTIDLGASGRDDNYGFGFPDPDKFFYEGLSQVSNSPIKARVILDSGEVYEGTIEKVTPKV